MYSIKNGFLVGLKTTWTLGKFIFPITVIVTILQHTPILGWIVEVITPFMKWIGLPGEAAIPLVLGNFLNLYAAIGAILTLDLTVKEVFILATMLSFSHNMFVESTVAAKVGVKTWVAVAVRVGLAIVSAFFIHLLWQGGGELAHYSLSPEKTTEVVGWAAITWSGVEKAIRGIIQLMMIIMPLMIVIQILKDRKWLNVFAGWMSPLTRLLGIKENATMTLATGFLLGLAVGAGVMIQAAKEDNVSKKDMTIAFIFLAACHAVIEDTLIFIPLGIPVLALLGVRAITAFILTIIVSFIWSRLEQNKEVELHD